jgi:hypothetical protein
MVALTDNDGHTAVVAVPTIAVTAAVAPATQQTIEAAVQQLNAKCACTEAEGSACQSTGVIMSLNFHSKILLKNLVL